MSHIRASFYWIGAAAVFLLAGHLFASEGIGQILSRTEPPTSATDRAPEGKSAQPASTAPAQPRVDGAVIRPFHQATVSSEVQGIVEKRYAKEGDLVKAGTVIFEISPEFFELVAQRAKERLEALEVALAQARQDLKVKEELIARDAATIQEITRARAEVKIAEHKMREAQLDLDLALRDRQRCEIRAPFKGYIVSLFRDAHEAVQRFEQLFLIADTSKVYAVVNVPQSLQSAFRKGAKAWFASASGLNVEGKVDKIEALIDPSSQTKKVYVLLDNTESKLEMGMLGSVTFAPRDR